jgi:hypothetical protein
MATSRLHARLVAPLDGPHALLTMAPAAVRMRDAASSTVAARLSGSTLQAATLSGAFRRLIAAKTPAAAKRAGHGIVRTLPLQNARAVVPGGQPPNPVKLVTNLQIQKVVLGHVLVINRNAIDRPIGTSGTTGSSTPAKKLNLVDQLTASQVAILAKEAPQIDARQPEAVQVAAPQQFQWVAPAPPTSPRPCGSTSG